jgi:hypothetical protein
VYAGALRATSRIMLSAKQDFVLQTAPPSQVANTVRVLRPGETLTLIGVDAARLNTLLAERPSTLRMLKLDLLGITTAAGAIERILDDLASLAVALWPDWASTDAPEFQPPLIPSWRRAAIRSVLAGRPPRFRRLAPGTELVHLLSMFPGLVFLGEVDPFRANRATPIIAALEWCRHHTAAVVALLAEAPAPEPPWDRLLHGAVAIERPPPEPAFRRLITPSSQAVCRGSATERRIREALRATPDLASLFEDEVILQLGRLGPTPRVDLLWRDGKVVVELDGAEHERDPNYAADRHRDYELLVAGYLVLRLTNAEIELDLGRALEKVRRVVNLRR